MNKCNEQTDGALAPLPYMKEIVHYLKNNEPELWQWFSSTNVKKEYAEGVHLDLLKSTYRLDRESHPDLYVLADEVISALSLNNQITFYQGQGLISGMNASLAYISGEIHVVFQGAILSSLDSLEIKALIGHELSHFMLWEKWETQYLTASQVLAAMTHDRQAESAHLESARLFDLYSEIFCDRGALYVTNNLNATISMQVKIVTGLQEVCPESYIRQSEEVFSKDNVKASGLSHPESFIRTRALKLWSENSSVYYSEIVKMIEGVPSLNELDLLGQEKVMKMTRSLIASFLSVKCIQSESVMAHARLYFDDFTSTEMAIEKGQLIEGVKSCDNYLKDYYCYVLLDFVAADPDLEDIPLAAALVLTRSLGIDRRFSEIVSKELNIKKKQFDKINQNAEKILEDVNKEEEQA
jgi:hypothetical protein